MAIFFDLRLWGVMLLAVLALIVVSAVYRAWIGYDDIDPQGPKG
ncbi:hypothetical protein [Sphingomonas sp. AP4-R1]|nr:hypothetical protein [Sphingomonas sp. AP4-R1]